MNPYHSFVSAYARLVGDGRAIPLGSIEMADATRPQAPPDAPSVLVFSPHPDDECIVGALPLRLLRQSRMRVVNVAVTQGSAQERQAARFEELGRACRFLGFGVVATRPGGLEKINRKTREDNPAHWSTGVEVIARILAEHRPRIILFPHDGDWNSTHIGTHLLVMDALARLPGDFRCTVVETEYWGAMTSPNLMVESTVGDVADLVAAISCHVEEVKRNPYHLLLPPWMQDNVRRGGELVGGQGGAPPDFGFATLYRARRWTSGGLESLWSGGRLLPADSDPGFLSA